MLLRSLALEMCRDKSILPALANIVGLLPGLLECEPHASRRGQKLQKIVGSVISLLLRDSAGRRGRGRCSRFSDFLHTTVVASSEFLVHLQDPLGQFSELASTHVSVLLLKHTLKQVTLFASTDGHATKHLLPAVPYTVVGVLHPAHVASPVVMEAVPAAVEAKGSRRPPIAVAISKGRHRWTSNVSR